MIDAWDIKSMVGHGPINLHIPSLYIDDILLLSDFY